MKRIKFSGLIALAILTVSTLADAADSVRDAEVSALFAQAGMTPAETGVRVAPAVKRAVWKAVCAQIGDSQVQMGRMACVATNALGSCIRQDFVSKDGTKGRAYVTILSGTGKVGYLALDGFEADSSATVARADAFVARRFAGTTGRAQPALWGAETLLDGRAIVSLAISGRKVSLPYSASYVYFIDDRPGANWGHPARLVFVDASLSSCRVLAVEEPVSVEVDGRDVLVSKDAAAKTHASLRCGISNAAVVSNGTGTDYEAVTDGESGNCYALIVSGGANQRNNHIRYWNDMAFAYNVLSKRYAVPKKNIKVFWASGNPDADICWNGSSTCYNKCKSYTSFNATNLKDLDGDGKGEIDGAASRGNLKDAFAWYAANLKATDQLFVFVTDHGGTYVDSTGRTSEPATLCLWGNSELRDTELADMTSSIAAPVILAMETCYSGGFCKEFTESSPNRLALTADRYDPSGAYYLDIDIWVYNFFSALCGRYPDWSSSVLDVRKLGSVCNADTDGDGRVSFSEAHAFAVRNNPFTAARGYDADDIDEPQCQPSGLASAYFLTQYADATPLVRGKVLTPTLSPAAEGGRFAPYTVSASCATAGATIRYTVDGSAPDERSACYGDGIVISEDCTVSVRAFKSGMDGSAVASMDYTVRKTAPEKAVVTSVSQADSSTAIVIDWLAGDGTDSFDVLRSESESMSAATAVARGLSSETYTYADTTAARGSTYYYQIRSRNAYGTTLSAASFGASLALNPPTGVTVVQTGSRAQTALVKVTWTPADGATHYRVYRRAADGTLTARSGWIAGREFTDEYAVSGGSAALSYYVASATGATGRGESPLSDAADVTVAISQEGWSMELVGVPWGTPSSALTALALSTNGSESCYARLKYADGTFADVADCSVVTWELVDAQGITMTTGQGSWTGPQAVLRVAKDAPEQIAGLRVRFTPAGGTELTREIPLYVSVYGFLRELSVSGYSYVVPGESMQLSVRGLCYGKTSSQTLPTGSEVTWSIIGGSGAIIDDDGVLTALTGVSDSQVVVQATLETSRGVVTGTQTVSIRNLNITKQTVEIEPLGGQEIRYIPREGDGTSFMSKSVQYRTTPTDWLSGIGFRSGSSPTSPNSGVVIDLGGGSSGNISISGYMFIVFTAARNPGKDREMLFKLRWSDGGTDYTIRQKEAPYADNPDVTVSGNALSASAQTDGSVVRYATDGEEPSAGSPILDEEVTFARNTPVAVKAFGEWMQESETVYGDVEGDEPVETVTVRFDPVEDGVTVPDDRTYAVSDTFGDLPVLEKEGLFFRGWTLYPDSTKCVSSTDYVPEEDAVLYACWSELADEEPDWVALPWDFKSSMTGFVKVYDLSADCWLETAVVGVEDADGVCRGSSKNGFGDWQDERSGVDGLSVFGIYGNVETGTESGLRFRVWIPDRGYALLLNADVAYAAETELGSESNPYVLQVVTPETWEDPATGIAWDYWVGDAGVVIAGTSKKDGVLILPEDPIDAYAVTSVADEAFAGLNLKTVIVPANITSLGRNAFSNCAALEKIDFEGAPPTGLAAAGIPETTLVRYNDAFEDEWIAALADIGRANADSYHLLTPEWNYSDWGDDDWSGIWCDDFGDEAGEVRIPRRCNGRLVTQISAFGLDNDDEGVVKAVVIPDSITKIGEGAFAHNAGLESVVLPSRLTEIPDTLFLGCASLASVDIPESVTSIGRFAFRDCPCFSVVDLSAVVTNVGEGAFASCPGLTAFDVAEENPVYAAVDGVLYDKNVRRLIQVPTEATSVEIPSTVRSIGSWAFAFCEHVGSVRIPASVTEIEPLAFLGCFALTNVTVDAKNKSFCVDDGVVYDKAKKTLVWCPCSRKAVSIPSTVTQIGECAFVYCTNLTEVILPKSVREIGIEAFEECLSLSFIEIPSAVTSIGDMAFYGCKALELTFKGAPPTCGSNAFVGYYEESKRGFYTGNPEKWLAVIDSEGKWNGLVMAYAGEAYVAPYVADGVGGKVSGGGIAKRDTKGNYKAVTLKATPNKGYWFAGWYDEEGEWMGSEPSLKVTPDGEASMVKYEARFTPAHTSLCGTYNGYACVNLKGMTLVKGATVDEDVYGYYPLTVTLSTAGKLSGAVTVGGKKVAFKADACCEASETDDLADGSFVVYQFSCDEKLWFGKTNVETLRLWIERSIGDEGYVEYGAVCLEGVGSEGAFAPLALGDEQSGFAYLGLTKADASLVKPFAGLFTTCLEVEGGGKIPLSVSVDAQGKVKATGKYADGTALTMNGTLAYRFIGSVEEDGEEDLTDHALVHLFGTPKSHGSGAVHVLIELERARTSGDFYSWASGDETRYTSAVVDMEPIQYVPVTLFSVGCWIPEDADPDFGVVRLMSGDDEVIDIAYASKNGVVTGLGKALTSGVSVTFDAKTGLLTVKKGREYTIQGVLGETTQEVGRINADGSCEPAYASFETLEKPEENFPWANADGSANPEFELSLGQNFSEDMQPAVNSGGVPLELTISGLPSGLKYDKKTGLITGAATKAGTNTVKVTYSYGTQKITRTTTFVVAPRPDELPVGSYAGYAEIRRSDGEDDQYLRYPLAATIDKNGGLTGSVTLFGKKATLKAGGYDSFEEGVAEYTSTLDLKAIDKSWGETKIWFIVSEDDMYSVGSLTFGDEFEISSVFAARNQTKDRDYAELAKPYVGNYVASYNTSVGDFYGVTTLSVAIDKKGTAKLAGTFVDGTAFSASAPLSIFGDGDDQYARLIAVVRPKSLGEGGICFDLLFSSYMDESGEAAMSHSWDARGCGYDRAKGAYTGIDFSLPYMSGFPYAYTSRAWVDESVDSETTFLVVTCDSEVFETAQFAWATKTVQGEKLITGVGKTINGSKVTLKIDDKTGLFSGAYGTYKIFGAMEKGTCCGLGTIVGKDGSIGTIEVWVGAR